jgi:hypothetical protein
MTRLGMVVVEVGVVTVVDSGGVDIITRNVVIEVMWWVPSVAIGMKRIQNAKGVAVVVVEKVKDSVAGIGRRSGSRSDAVIVVVV